VPVLSFLGSPTQRMDLSDWMRILATEVLNAQTMPIAIFALSTDPSSEALVSSSTVPKQWSVFSCVEHDVIDSSTQERDCSSHLESSDANACELGAKGTQRRFSQASSMELKRWVKLLNEFRVGMFQKVLKVIYVSRVLTDFWQLVHYKQFDEFQKLDHLIRAHPSHRYSAQGDGLCNHSWHHQIHVGIPSGSPRGPNSCFTREAFMLRTQMTLTIKILECPQQTFWWHHWRQPQCSSSSSLLCFSQDIYCD